MILNPAVPNIGYTPPETSDHSRNSHQNETKEQSHDDACGPHSLNRMRFVGRKDTEGIDEPCYKYQQQEKQSPLATPLEYKLIKGTFLRCLVHRGAGCFCGPPPGAVCHCWTSQQWHTPIENAGILANSATGQSSATTQYSFPSLRRCQRPGWLRSTSGPGGSLGRRVRRSASPRPLRSS